MPRIFITSYPYVYERYFKVFDYFKNKEDLIFILPEKWKTRAGFILPPERNDIKIIKTKAYFYGSKYPVVRGLLKGWMPATSRILKKHAKPGDILYTAVEPNLLTTYLNGRLAQRLALKHMFFTWQNVPYRQRLSGMKLKFTEWLIRKNVSMSTGAICGNTKATGILKQYASEDFKILTVPISGVDTDKFKPGIQSDFREKYGLQNKIVILFAGVMDERKGIMTLVEAFSKTIGSRPGLHLVLIGTGPLKEKAKDFVEKYNLQSSVTFIDWLPNEDLPGIFSNSDIFAYPSAPAGGWEEQFGYSIAEASACELPIISTDTGSINEVVLQNETGILVKPNDATSLKEAIIRLADNEQQRKMMGLAGRKHVLANFAHEKIAEKIEDFFKGL